VRRLQDVDPVKAQEVRVDYLKDMSIAMAESTHLMNVHEDSKSVEDLLSTDFKEFWNWEPEV